MVVGVCVVVVVATVVVVVATVVVGAGSAVVVAEVTTVEVADAFVGGVVLFVDVPDKQPTRINETARRIAINFTIRFVFTVMPPFLLVLLS